MALELDNVTAPGGLTIPKSYRRLLGIHVDYLSKSIQIGHADYRDEAWRKDHPYAYVNNAAISIAAQSVKAADLVQADPNNPDQVLRDKDGNPVINKRDAAPSFDQFLAQPLSTYLANAGPTTTIGEMLGAIGYGYLKTRSENKGAVDA